MPIEFRCTNCNKLLRTGDGTAGKQAKCPECGTLLVVPDASTAAPAIATPATGAAPLAPPPFVNPPVVNPLRSGPFAAQTESSNPYKSPITSADMTAPIMGQTLASRGQRFLGALIDGLLYLPFMVGVLMWAFSSGMLRQEFGQIRLEGLMLVAILPLAIFQWYLISNTGQSIGKKAVGTRIVKYADGTNPGFLYGVVMRAWVPALIGMVPCLGGLFGLADALWIFSAERRCLHDLIAQTRVIEV
jgi:uncharacterized RDD family membrane protein YckC/phage FluMu protein Com